MTPEEKHSLIVLGQPPKLVIAIIIVFCAVIVVCSVIVGVREGRERSNRRASVNAQIIETEEKIKRVEGFAASLPDKLAQHRSEQDKHFRKTAVIAAYAGFRMALNGRSWNDVSNTVWNSLTENLEIREP